MNKYQANLEINHAIPQWRHATTKLNTKTHSTSIIFQKPNLCFSTHYHFIFDTLNKNAWLTCSLDKHMQMISQ
jgi:hypothetical protein